MNTLKSFWLCVFLKFMYAVAAITLSYRHTCGATYSIMHKFTKKKYILQTLLMYACIKML